MVKAPFVRAWVSAPWTKGVVPPAVIPKTTSFSFSPRASSSAPPAFASSSAPSMAAVRAAGPPAMMAWISSGSEEKAHAARDQHALALEAMAPFVADLDWLAKDKDRAPYVEALRSAAEKEWVWEPTSR